MADGRDFYGYVSDNGVTYQVGLSTGNASAGSFGAPIAEGSAPGFPVGWRMRHVNGRNIGLGKNTVIPIASNTDTFYTAGGAVSKDGTVFSIGGRIGERMTSKK
jgi:hypothetical protein